MLLLSSLSLRGIVSMEALALCPPHINVDALPYIDTQYNDLVLRRQVDSLINEETVALKSREDLQSRWPQPEPDFEVRLT